MRPQTIVERLDFVAKRILGLKFTPPTQLKPGDDQVGCFMSCDMYYIEIKVDQSHQFVKDVVISHGNSGDGVSCPVLRKVLADQDFETFAKHLSGLHSIYQISTNDKKVKQKAYPALSALETDLTILYEHQRRRIYNNCHDLVHKTPIGIMEPRKGGLPVRLTFFTTPYDSVDIAHKEFTNLTINNIIDRNLGLSVTVEIEGSAVHKLQTKSLIGIQQSLPIYAPFNNQNSEKLPAQFVLKLSQPFPMLITSINQISNDITHEPQSIKDYFNTIVKNSKESLVSLIARQELDLNKGPFCRSVDILKSTESEVCDMKKHVYLIKLLDQIHTYHILDGYLGRQDGYYVTKIPFTHPASIPTILKVLRQQALFNFVIGSCIRGSKNSSNSIFDESESNIFDIIPVSLSNICVSFEHPSKESLATLEIDFKELNCQLYAIDKDSVCSNEFATKVLQKCWSIPITLRAVLKKCNERRLALLEDANKRREREMQYKPHLQYQETLLQSKFNSIYDKTNSRDLNSIAELLSSKTASTSNSSSNQVNVNTDSASNRTNLLKKFSCKPKTKQTAATKNQTGNKILSLMLKRQNSNTTFVDDHNLKATITKKAKTKSLQGESSAKNSGSGITTTKLISSEIATAARFTTKQAKPGVNQNTPVSLIRSPSKSQPSAISSSSNSSISVGVGLSSQSASSSSTNSIPNSVRVNLKAQANGNNSQNKPRKSSINAVLDRLVTGVTPEQSLSNHAGSSNDSNPESVTQNPDSSKGSPLGSKSKSRTPADQFAIKQGSLGSLKLTVTKTKPATATASSSSFTSTSTSSLSTSTPTAGSSSSDTNKILGLGSSTPQIKYTIPKISKTQANSTESQNSTNEPGPTSDDSGNPSSSANAAAAPSSTTNKRNNLTPFNRTNSSNKNPVSSSTHPLGRTTSNPLAPSRPSSTSTSESHILNRISSSNQGHNMRQQITNRLVNLQPQPGVQRTVGAGIISAQQQQPQQMNLQVNPGPMFAIGLQQQLQPSGPFQNANDIDLIAANQAALLNQQRNQSMQQVSSPFMSSSIDANLITSSRPQFAATLPPTIPVGSASNNNLDANVGDSMQRPSPSVINAPPQFYVRQPLFDDTSNTVSSTPRMLNEASQSSTIDRKIIDIALQQQPSILAAQKGIQSRATDGQSNNAMVIDEMSSSTASTTPAVTVGGNQGVSSSSDSRNQDYGPTISTPSSPTECGPADIVAPPPLIPVDSLDEPQATSPETDHPDDASDRLSIVDTNENLADSNSIAGTPKPSNLNSPMVAQDSNSASPSSLA